jgi:single-strand DNA-binding protein
MANDLNQCNFIGRTGQDPEIKYAPSGTAICNFSIAVGYKYKEEESTEWVRVVAFGKLAELIGEYVQKGKQLYVSGRMQTRSWEDKDGNKRYTTEIVANNVQFLGGGSDKPKTSSKEHAEGF